MDKIRLVCPWPQAEGVTPPPTCGYPRPTRIASYGMAFFSFQEPSSEDAGCPRLLEKGGLPAWKRPWRASE